MKTYREYQSSGLLAGPKATRYQRIADARQAAVDEVVARLLSVGCKRIEGFSQYLISPTGDVYSAWRGRVLKVSPGKKPGGYLFVGLRGAQGIKYKMVHRLVAETFIPNPKALPVVNHIDGDKNNNSANNLEWASHLENSRHAFRIGLVPLGPEKSNSKLTTEEIHEIRSSKESCRQAGRRFGVSAQVICNVRNRRTYKSVL